MNKKYVVDTNRAPRAIGPYSQAVGYNGLLFVSGQIAIDPETGEVINGSVEVQTRRCMDNLQQVLMAAGLDFSHVLKTTIYLRNMNDFTLVNEVYALYFDHSPPARATVEVSRLPKDVTVEIDLIAAAPTDYVALTKVEEDEHKEDAKEVHENVEKDEESTDDSADEPTPKEDVENDLASASQVEELKKMKLPSPSEISEATDES